MRILILCTGNSCRSQMAEGILKNLFPQFEIYSAGTHPETKVNDFAIKVMQEIGIDIASHYPKDVNNFIDKDFDYVITVCNNAKENCPVFTGKVKYKIHKSFEDPAKFNGTESEKLNFYRKIRDEIKDFLTNIKFE
ncbi:MAG: arsenate reductase ArsC [Bacteroidales bacterium]|nr:arsenate reductase ArsC [Bacteroidales bacterium]